MTIEIAEAEKILAYSLGNIPNSWAWPDTKLVFRIDTENVDDHSLTVAIDEQATPLPKGTVFLDEHGVFTYERDPADNVPFYVEFSASIAGTPLKQRCQITPIPLLPEERERIVSQAEIPKRESTNYLAITTRKHSDESEDHMISGMRIVFDKYNDENRLWKSYHRDPEEYALPEKPVPQGTIRNLVICADEVVIHGELCLPETNVSVFARRLVLKNREDQPGCIKTSPSPYKNARPDTSEDGAHGRTAGNISLFIHEADTGSLNECHFNLRGGSGQGAGMGENGEDGLNNYESTSRAKYGDILYSFDPPAIHFHLTDRIWGPGGMEGNSWNWGSGKWPTDGKPAIKPGKPGNGGDGGNFTSNYSFTQALPPTLIHQFQKLKDKNKAIVKLVDNWVIDYLYKKLTAKQFLAMLDHASELHLRQIIAALQAFTDMIKQTQQMLQDRDVEQSHALLATLTHTTQAALAKTDEAAQYIKDAKAGKIIKRKEFTVARQIMGAGARIRDQVQHAESALRVLPDGAIDNYGANAGAMANDVYGGMAGCPSVCGNYEIKCYTDPIGNLHRWSQKCTKKVSTENGASFAAHPADIPVGKNGTIELKTEADYDNVWLHPALLQTLLLYTRDAYLAAPEHMRQLQPLLQDYKKALEALPPADIIRPFVEQTGTRFSETVYHNTLTEITTLLHRSASHLDYYGYPSGWTPLFSLPVCLRMYENELNYGLKALLLAQWMDEKAQQAEQISNIAGESITSLNEATRQATAQIATEKDNMHSLRDQAHSLSQEIQDLNIRLDKKRNELLDKAEQNSRIKSWVNFGVSTISALCQVIPYGQPALGALGSAGKNIANNIINNNDPISNVGPLNDLLAQFTKAKLDEKASQLVEASKEKKSDNKASEAADRAAKLSHIGKNIGPALADVSSAIQGLSVPQGEVDARMQQLEAECPEFQDMLRDLRALNIRKADFAQKLNESLQSLSSSYAQITSNLLTVSNLENQRREQLAVLDHETVLYSRGMAQHARITLTKYLYYLARCYEYAVLEPIEVNYQLPQMLNKITALLQSNPKTDAESIQRISDKEIAPLFQQELKKIEDKLQTNFIPEYMGDLEIRLSTEQTPHLVELLNSTGEVVINLRDFNCIPSRYERITIDDISVVDLEFDSNKPVPDSGTVELTVEPRGEGTLRSSNHLYVVRHPTTTNSSSVSSESQQIWGTRYHFGSHEMKAIRPSKASMELLDTLLGDTKKQIKEKMAKPAAWSDVTIRYTRFVQAPRLKSVRLHLACNWTQSSKEYCALDVRLSETDVPLLMCSPNDVSGKSNGFGSIFRIYPINTRVRLEAPVSYGTRMFSHWQVFDNTDTMEPRDVQGAILEIEKIEHNMMVRSIYVEQHEEYEVAMSQPAPLLRLISSYAEQLPTPSKERVLEAVSSEAEPEILPEEERQHQMKLQELIAGEMQTWQHDWSNCIVNTPGGISIAYLPPDAQFSILEGPTVVEGKEWTRIDYRGVVGWVSKLVV